jgi:pimeloyl-ACP methyl ester carboxylesterase
MSTNGPHPIRFAELLATDADQQAASSYMDLFRSEEAEEYLTADVLETWFDEFLGEEDLAIYREAWEQPGAITGGLNWYRANTISQEEVANLMEGRSSVISMPVSVLWGVDDTAVLVSNAEGLDEYASDLEVDLIDDVDHWIEHHVPEDVANAIRSLDARAQ